MNIQSMSVSMEKYVMPLADKLGNEIHLRAIRDAFMSLLPITFTGGIAAVLSSAPSVDAPEQESPWPGPGSWRATA